MKEFKNDENKKNHFIHQAHLEGRGLFYQAQKDRKDNPSLKIPSNDDLIKIVKGQCDDSVTETLKSVDEKTNKSITNVVIENKVKDLLAPQKSSDEMTALGNEANQSSTAKEFFDRQLSDVNIQIDELRSNQTANADLKKELNNRKNNLEKRLSSNSPAVKNVPVSNLSTNSNGGRN
ncbi:MAG: hypothetical protein MJ210_05205, partial [Alphaproteobacteria bacterium]|nr:hypothetical protein [Alphaproteobacteria bacterium]